MSSSKFESPAKPIRRQTADDGSGYTSFTFRNPGNKKTVGISPAGKTRIPLERNKTQGGNHGILVSPGDTKYADENNFYDAPTFKKKYAYLFLALNNLKQRVDEYYHTEPDQREYSHFAAIHYQAQKCLDMLQKMVSLPEKRKGFDFLRRLNRALQNDDFREKLYNPIDLMPHFNDANYILDARNYVCFDQEAIDRITYTPSRLTESTILATSLDPAIIGNMDLPDYHLPQKEKKSKATASNLFRGTFLERLTHAEDVTPVSTAAAPKRSLEFQAVEVSEAAEATEGRPSFGMKPFSLFSPGSAKKVKSSPSDHAKQAADAESTTYTPN